MSDPKEDLVQELSDYLMHTFITERAYADTVAKSFFSAYAHELAKQVRQNDPPARYQGSFAFASIWREATKSSANLIDPTQY